VSTESVTDGARPLVSLERGEIDRRIFSDPDIFEEEMRHIFGRSWLFLCHGSQIPKRGDFFEAPMGRDNVLVVRQRDGGIKGLLNTCAHRGNAVCRAEEGNAKNFMCTYHGWTYDIAGKLVGVPGLDELYHNELDVSANGLREVAQLEVYKGFVFATLDLQAPPLLEFLGRTGVTGLEFLAGQGELEVVPGIQKFVIPCNWKFAVDNIFDWYHPQITHLSAFQTGLAGSADVTGTKMKTAGVAGPDGSRIQLPGGVASGDASDQLVFIDAFGHAISGPTIERRTAIAQRAIHSFGPAGFLEQEDGENWAQSTLQTRGNASAKIPQLLQMNLRRGKVVHDSDRLDPPYIECSINEHGQLWTFASWVHWLSGCDWPELRERTAPPDVI
jgi:phenylpropionate dioxygenase-like ring-hydroxylating dioxygenase large terminal subunit